MTRTIGRRRPGTCRGRVSSCRPIFVFDPIDAEVSRAFESALDKIAAAGGGVSRELVLEFDLLPELTEKGGIVAAECYEWHETLLAAKGDAYDPRIAQRIRQGAEQTASDYIRVRQKRQAFIDRMTRRIGPYDAMLAPTVPIVAPRIEDIDSDAAFTRYNALALHNTSLVNMFDGCAFSIPAQEPGDAPVGLMIAAANGLDQALIDVAAAMESVVRPAARERH